MARTFEYVLHFVRCVTVTVSPNQIIIIIIIIKEAIWIRKSMPVLNRDEGGYQLSHIYDSLTIPTSGDQSS